MSKPILAAMLSCSGTCLTEEEKRIFAQANPLGISLFSRNIIHKKQLANLIHEIKEVIGRDDVLIAVDQEGGRVRRLTEPEFRSYAHNITIGALPPRQSDRAATLQTILISAELREMGINLNYAPVLDLIHPQTSPVLKSRCFSSSELVVSRLGKIMVDEYINQGVIPCIKHMPGHGRAAVDPHLCLPRVGASLTELARDIYPFQQLRYTPAGMTAHIIVDAVDPLHPVTQSADAIRVLIRGQIGFEGLLISDALDMHALRGTLAEKARISLDAGCDCICYALGSTPELASLADNCPPLSDAALERFQRLKSVLKQSNSCQKINIAPLAEEYASLIGSVEPYNDTYDATEVLNQLKSKGENKC